MTTPYEKIHNLQRKLDRVMADNASLESRYSNSVKENEGLQRKLENAFRTILDLERMLKDKR